MTVLASFFVFLFSEHLPHTVFLSLQFLRIKLGTLAAEKGTVRIIVVDDHAFDVRFRNSVSPKCSLEVIQGILIQDSIQA